MTDAPTVQFLERRRSAHARDLAAPGPSEPELVRLLAIAARVPDHGRLAPWRFIVIEGGARERLGLALERLVVAREPEATESRREVERSRFTRAPMVVCVVSRAGPHVKIPEWEQILSAGAVCQTLLIGALAMGYGAQWLTEWVAYDAAALAAIGLAPGERVAGFIHIGTRTVPADERPRPDVAELVTRLGGPGVG